MDRALARIWVTMLGALGLVGIPGAKALAAAPPAGSPVLVELFTSQGCSSCPPADRLLSRLGSDARWRGRVVPLAFHVDYWNTLGWADTFSRPEWSRRQEEYAAAVGSRRIYTPQAVIDGGEECVGSEEDEVLSRIERAAARPAGRVTIAVRRDGAGFRVDLDLSPPRDFHRPLQVMLAVYESGLLTDVRRGENAGRRAADDFVVRRLEKIADLAAGAGGQATAAVALDPAWRAERVGVAAFLQDPASRAVLGVASAALTAP